MSPPGQGGVQGEVPLAAFRQGQGERLGGAILAAFHLDLGDWKGAHTEKLTQAAAEAPVPDRYQGLSLLGQLHHEHEVYA